MNMPPDLTVVILTFNESVHIERAIASVKECCREVLVVDSYSTDATVSLASAVGARVIQHPFVNQADQMAWALREGGISTEWVMRLDADEYLTPSLKQEIIHDVPALSSNVGGIIIKRQVHFMGKWIRYGGYYPVRLLRIWRNGWATIEQRRMDEHMYLTHGEAYHFKHDLVDENLHHLGWWTAKHNDYATREAMDILVHKHPALFNEAVTTIDGAPQQAKRTRWLKANVYLKLPLFIRPCLYFVYRYIFRFGFLDGRKGLVWHFLQGFWYRFLVDAKVLQIEWMAARKGISVKEVVQDWYGIR